MYVMVYVWCCPGGAGAGALTHRARGLAGM
jgi:hypothetical protein